MCDSDDKDDVPLAPPRQPMDPRMDRIAAFALTTLRLKHDKWQKMINTEEFRLIILDWLNNAQRRILVMSLSPGGYLVPKISVNEYSGSGTGVGDLLSTTVPVAAGSTASTLVAAAASTIATATTAALAPINTIFLPLPPPSSSFSTLDGVPRGKSAYFLKKQPTIVTLDNFSNEILCGDLPVHNKVESLAILLDEIYLPLLNNSFNRKLWPEIVANDLQVHMKAVRNTLAEIKGKTNNRTILSLLVSPTTIQEVREQVTQGNLSTACDAKFLSLLEEMIVNWTTQIYEILNERSECTNNTGGVGETSGFGNVTSATTTAATTALPSNEVFFWTARKFNLQNIYEQMRSPAIRSIAFILERIESVYHPSFNKIFKDLILALHEAQDITLWLQPIIRHTSAFNAVNFINSLDLVEPLVHVVHLIWTNSRYYRTTKRVTLLLRTICNLLVHHASEDLEFPILFHGDADEGLMKIVKTIEVLELFKAKIFEYKQRFGSQLSAASHSADVGQHLWGFASDEVFGCCLEGFLNQLCDLRTIFESAVSFQNLEKLEIGGMRGKFLTDQLKQIHCEFKGLFEDWTKIDIEFSNQNAKWKKFKREQTLFFQRIEILENKLTTILIKAIDDCNNWEQFVKLAIMFGGTLKRLTSQPDLKVILPHIFQIYRNELEQIESAVSEVLFNYENEGLSAVPVDENFPPMSGAQMWIEKFMKRLEMYNALEFTEVIRLLSADSTTGEYTNLCGRGNALTTKLTNLQLKIWNNWLQTIAQRIESGLEAVVMMRVVTPKKLQINFPVELFAVLKETKYLLTMTNIASGGTAVARDIPTHVLDVFKQQNKFWNRKIKLIKIEECYNGIHEDVRQCELKLIRNEIEQIDACVDVACKGMTWRLYDIDLVKKIYDKSSSLYNRITQAHTNLNRILESIRTWSNEPLHQRSIFGRNLLELRHQKERLRSRLLQCAETKTLINRLLAENFCLFFNYTDFPINSKDIPINEFLSEFQSTDVGLYWNYLNTVDDKICTEVHSAMQISLEYLENEMAPHTTSGSANGISSASPSLSPALSTAPPLFEVKLELVETEICFSPSLNSGVENNLQQIVDELLDDIRKTCECIPRVTATMLEDHKVESRPSTYDANPDLDSLRSRIRNYVNSTISAAKQCLVKYDSLSFLWSQRKEDVLLACLDELRDNNATLGGSILMETFKKKIDRFNDLHDDIEEFDSHQTVNGWLSIDVNPLKYALLNHACKWANLFKQWLLRYVIDTLQKLHTFITTGTRVLTLQVNREDFRVLLKVLAVMSQIKKRDWHADNIFKSLKDIISLLKSYNVEIHMRLLKDIDQLPMKWKNLKDVAEVKFEALANIRRYQEEIIASIVELFMCHVNAYTGKFQNIAFFSVPCDNVYALCDTVFMHLARFDSIRKRILYCAKLLDIPGPDETNLMLCAAEVKRIKKLWDFVRVIESCIVDWKSTPWCQIDTDDMENECKKFTKDLRTLDKGIREWEPYIYIVSVLKDLVSSLRAITELQNPAITERHWMELMRIQLKCNESTTLEQLLALDLHHCEEDIKNTVDRAIKEMTVSKILEEIKTTWDQMQFDTEMHQQRQLRLLKVSEELLETLDDNQMQLQNIATSKHIDYLLGRLSQWQEILANVDVLITRLFDVQRKWIYLESIFIGSADIRAQLPLDAERFEETDAEFTQLLAEVIQTRFVIKVVLQHQHIYEILEKLQLKLAICEKTLNDYLETKRLAFPRFYFISSADLLDILSNGNNPKIIDRHLIKLFDSILRLEFQTNSIQAVGMHSKENEEYVRFVGDGVECSGRVECWLNEIILTMRGTLHELFKCSLKMFTEKPRDQWLFDWPAQTALCCSQICWTSDVNRAFAWIEEGYEAAMKELHKRQIAQLNALITLLLGELNAGDRQKIMTICTIDVHSRDVVLKIIQTKVDNALAFQWQSQLRHRWDDGEGTTVKTTTTSERDAANYDDDCYANICDAEFRYAYEYLGNTSRLVITPLTDRCYITLTQSLHLVMGGAPAGPAGTGKTETTKDLGRALGVMVYVFNCSEQMDYKSCGNIYKGLSQTGAWGCFDEFNRISVEVLSVVAVQVKTIQEAIKLKKSQFTFMGETISLMPSVGIFITMNPGYAGRTELPENLKTLFRPCAMIVPDFALICEIMLMAEGFQEARLLARKFITLYTLCRELLSKQDHYDWGLRAIKSVLVVAGTLKRDDHSRPEDQVLMRALRDFNIPKIVTEDVAIFMGLIGDLFPALDVPRKRVFDFEKTIRQAVSEIKLQPEEGFLMKVVQLQELLDVRHSVFIVGNAGTGKTKIWQTLCETYKIQKLRPVCNVLNPKALSNDELFGIVNPTTREWKDGLFSSIMREQANLPAGNPKWIVLDGDIDPMWIESLNTLMDDNKVLTLASNERISLKKEMRLIFEVGHLKAATPATVSRAGILYINPQDLGWFPYVSSWLETRSDIMERGLLTGLFEKYFPSLVSRSRDFRKTTPISDMAMIQMTCHLLECLLHTSTTATTTTTSNTNTNDPDTGTGDTNMNMNQHLQHPHHQGITTESSMVSTLEIIFAFASIWGFGSALYQDHIIDWHREFHKWWTAEFKDVKFPSQGIIFDYFFDVATHKFTRWESLASIERFEMPDSHEIPLQNVLVPTAETARLRYFLKILIEHNHPCMLVGTSGCGKGAIFREIFNAYATMQDIDLAVTPATSPVQQFLTVQKTYFNFYTSSEIFQKVLDRPLEKKSGRCYGPSGNKRLIYYVNDLNMPEVDAYGTVQPHTIMRQFMDYHQWYDRNRLLLKDIRNCQFAACMNPTAGSFSIDPRLQRHFCAFSVGAPSDETLHRIYSSILSCHLGNPLNCFGKEIKSICTLLVSVGIALHRRVEYAFLPTAVKFHYLFNLRDLTNIYQGLMNSTGSGANAASAATTGSFCARPAELIRLYVHEAFRVYHDRLVDQYDIKAFKAAIRDIFKKDFEDFDEDTVFAEPLIYSHFAQSLVDQKYLPLRSWDNLFQLLIEAQANYNEVVGYMNLVMFEDAMIHVCRINRILESPRGNALLIGVGGSGKQTLARLASFISSLSVFQIQVKRGFCLQDMKDEIAGLYLKVGLKNVASVFLMSDVQIPDESILTLCNDMLASGDIPDLFTDDQFEAVVNGIRNEVKQSGSLDTKDNCWHFFIEKVRRLLKVVLCFSPVGPTLRVRARKFPAIISRTSIDWFHAWPKTALESVSKKFLSEIDYVLPCNIVDPIGSFMAYVHGTVNQISKIYLQNEKRFNYTTPKTFLEYIFLYRKLLVDKSGEHTSRINRLESGMAKLAECARQVDTLKNQLAVQETELTAKNVAADKLIVIVSAESEKVKREKFTASEEEKRVRIIEEDVSIKTKMCEEDLRKAEPALVAAQAALNTLNKNNLTELKSFGSPPKAVVNVCAAVMVLLATNGKIPRDRNWRAAKLMMVRVDQFLSDLVNYNKDNIHPNIIEVLQEYLKDPEFNPDKIVQKSVAAAGLCAWVINIHRYHQVFLIVGPKQQALQDSQDELLEARRRLEFLKTQITDLEGKLSEIQAEFEEAVAEKQKCQRDADQTSFTIDLAHRLINGLANENIRWRESVFSLKEKIGNLPGDILLISSFLSYVGCFTRRYRHELQEKMWMENFQNIVPLIPHTAGVDPLTLISDDAQIAVWNNEGLPMDRMSTENATILTNSTRWPLMIDPQLQGIKWIRNRYGDGLVVLRLTQRGYLEVLEKSISRGDVVLIEHIEEAVDTVLEPLLSRALTKKGRFIRIGDKEVDFNENFRLILHTKLPNPHYRPEMQAQTTLINFTVTPDGLEEQLLAEVVKIERADLEQMKTDITIQQNKFKISLKALEDELLARLASAGENVLADHALVINLEATKKTVDEIETKVAEARLTTVRIDETRNIYRAAAKRAAILYFVLTDLSKINPIYRFSLRSFMAVFKQAISVAAQGSSLEARVSHLVESITLQTFLYTLRGLFEADKLTFTSHMILRIMIASETLQITKDEVDFLLRFPHDPNTLSPVDFVGRSSWGGIKSLALMEHFYGIDKDIETYPKRWRKFLESDAPERQTFPGEWKHRSSLQRLCIMRALRPDRMTHAMRLFIEQTMGRDYADVQLLPFAKIFKEVTSATPVFFILSPGVDPVREVELLGRQFGFTEEAGNLRNISLGQGQEVIAEHAMVEASSTGQQWVILQNIHLVVNWLPTLEKLIEKISGEGESSLSSSSNFRLFISAEPAPDPQYHVIPQGILEASIKIVNEPPSGMAANLHKAWDHFDQQALETCTQEAEFKSILFALCYFHAVASERRKFGPQGWNKIYPFNTGDLSISANVLHNYLEGSNRIPWEDLRYLLGEIMYGGHITDDWDRRLCQTYLEELLQQELVDGDFELCPGFRAPPNLDFDGYHTYISRMLPDESPVLYGLHSNAEIGLLTTASDTLLKTIFELQPRESELSSNCGAPREELVKIMIDDFLDKLQDEFNLQSLLNRVERKTPFVVVALQECERMNALIREIKRSLRELMLGLKGELTITLEMERLDNAIFYDHIPESWSRLAYPSLLGLQGWFADLIHRIKELASWLNDFKLPCAIWLGGLFNPQSFLTAIMQESARKHDLPLDRMCLSCDVTKKEKDDVTLPPMEGAFVHGLFLDGASWDHQLNSIVPLPPNVLLCAMPVIYIKSIVQEKKELQRVYECPLYQTRSRGSTYVWTFNLKTKNRPSKWILGGVALLLQS